MSTVLIVDDEEGLLEVISDVIAGLGDVPVMAHDGLEAWALAKEHRPDSILSDQMMPRLTGVELMRQVRRDAGLQNIPFILMSAASPSGADWQADPFFCASPSTSTRWKMRSGPPSTTTRPLARRPSRPRPSYRRSALVATCCSGSVTRCGRPWPPLA